jgi:hypothetical protein
MSFSRRAKNTLGGLVLLGLLFFASPVLAQDPDCTTTSFTFDSNDQGWYNPYPTNSNGTNSANPGIYHCAWAAGVGYPDGGIRCQKPTTTAPNYYYNWFMRKDIDSEIQLTEGSNISVWFDQGGSRPEQFNRDMWIYFTDGSSWKFINGDHTTYWLNTNLPIPEAYYGKSVDYLEFKGYVATSYSSELYFDTVDLDICASGEVQEKLCSTVTDADFVAEETSWLLANEAVIADGRLALPAGGQAAQNLNTLSSNQTYNAVISATVVNATTTVDVILGTEIDTLSIEAPGYYTTTVTTPVLGGPIVYGLENTGAAGLDIGFTCLSLDTGDGSDQRDCIAPTNGRFDSVSGWGFYHGASWQAGPKNVLLPYNSGETPSLLSSTSLYDLPAIEEEEYLLLGFDAETKNDDSGMIASLVQAGTSYLEQRFEIFPSAYEFEADISDLSGSEAQANVAFSNPGSDPEETFSATDDVYLDNVCIWVSDRGPTLPGPVDPTPAITPIEMGFNYSCADIPGILAGYGINMNYYHQVYNDGIGWDNWWAWLMAGFWLVLEALLCFLVTALGWLVDVLEYQVNNLLNLGGWFIRQSGVVLTFVSSLWDWSYSTVKNVVIWAGGGINAFVGWLLDSGSGLLDYLGAFYNFLIENWSAVLAWIAPALIPFSGGFSILLLLADLLWTVIDLMVLFLSWIWVNIFETTNIPIRFYYAFDEGVKSDAFGELMSCSGENFWCGLLAGVQLVNQTVGHTVLYPIVIVGIILGTIGIFWRNIWGIFSVTVR